MYIVDLPLFFLHYFFMIIWTETLTELKWALETGNFMWRYNFFKHDFIVYYTLVFFIFWKWDSPLWWLINFQMVRHAVVTSFCIVTSTKGFKVNILDIDIYPSTYLFRGSSSIFIL